MPDVVHHLVATEAAIRKLGRRGIAIAEAEQTLANRHVLVRNVRGAPDRRQRETRRLLIGATDGGRPLTLVIEQTLDPTTWLLVTGWASTPSERKIAGT